jgi:hypothetical protein
MLGLRVLKQRTKSLKARQARGGLIGTLGERGLHSALKDWYAGPGDRLEAEVDGFHIDILRHKLLIEIQTSNFSSQRKKVKTLTEKHHVRLVFPIAKEKWIVRLSGDGVKRLGRRKSPKKGHLFHLFEELVSIPGLIRNENFSLEVLFIQEEEVRCDDSQGSWRRKGWSVADHRLLGVLSRHIFGNPSDFLDLIPQDLPDPFSTHELAKCIEQPRWLAQKMAYCLRHMGIIEVVGKKGNSLHYSVSNSVTRQLSNR